MSYNPKYHRKPALIALQHFGLLLPFNYRFSQYRQIVLRLQRYYNTLLILSSNDPDSVFLEAEMEIDLIRLTIYKRQKFDIWKR